MIRVTLFSILLNCLMLSPSVAQQYNNRGVSAYKVSSCLEDHAEVGKMVGQAYAIVRKNERVHGGTLYFQESSAIRSLIYSETITVRDKISDIAYSGDAQQCHRLKQSARQIINNILSQSF